MKGQQTVSTFLEWHSAQTQLYKVNKLVYDFQQELVSYCQSDVKLLKEDFLKFRTLIKKVCSGIDPFEVACTAASACNYIYRQLFMPKDSIAILPQNGYTGNELTSFLAAVWLSWVEQVANDRKSNEFSIRLYKSGGGLKRGRGKEQTLGSFKVDGLLLYKRNSQSKSTACGSVVQKPQLSIVLEFFGCYFHGCPSCYTDRDGVNKKRNATTMHDLYTTTVMDRLDWISAQISNGTVFTTTDNLRFVVHSIFFIWECEFKNLLKLSISEDEEGIDTTWTHLPRSVAARLSSSPSSISDDIQQVEQSRVIHQTLLYRLSNIKLLQQMSNDSIRYSPLQPRDAFFGGRTENFVMKWSRQLQSQTFKYVDVCSLYPYVNSRSVYPSGHPDLILIATEQQQQSIARKEKARNNSNSANEKPPQTSCFDEDVNVAQGKAVEFKFLDRVDRILTMPSNERDSGGDQCEAEQPHSLPPPQRFRKFSQRTLLEFPITFVELKLKNEDYFGLLKCQVLPPSDIHLPILPFKLQSKLFFPLCRSCVEERSSMPDKKSVDLTSKKCVHRKVEERSFWGTFATPEVKLALENGYRVIDVAEIWSWSRAKRSVTLFKEYIDNFLKIKMEASGWPKTCRCEEKMNSDSSTEMICEHRRRYLQEMKKKEGISLDPARIEKNEGLRFIAKILLNSFWGYLEMRDNMPKTRYVNNYREVVDYFTSRTKRVTDATLVGDDLMLLQYQLIDDAADAPRKTNVILAAFTTAHARIKLFNNMQLVKNPKNVLYCDTHSIMYVHDQSLTDSPDISIGSGLGEMTDELPPDVLIDKFWSAGPKFFCLSGHNVKTGLEYNIFKVKGVTLNRATEKTFNPDTFRKLVLGETHELRSPYSSLSRCVRTGQLKNKFCEKRARVTSNKRVCNTIPANLHRLVTSVEQ